MSYWNHRVVKENIRGEDWYSVREVYYNDDGSIWAHDKDAVKVSGESIAELRESLQWMLAALDKPVLVAGEVEFVEHGAAV